MPEAAARARVLVEETLTGWASHDLVPFKPHSESGRGMHIVAAVAAADGAFPVAEPRGKLTWARMET